MVNVVCMLSRMLWVTLRLLWPAANFVLHEVHMLSVLRNKLSSLQNGNLMQAWFIQDFLTNSFE